MSNTPAAKRRRVEAANATLRQPFRSPVIRTPAPANDAPTAAPTITTDPAVTETPSRKRGPHHFHSTARKAPAPSSPLKISSRVEPTFVWSLRRAELEEKNAALEKEIARLRDDDVGDGIESAQDELDALIVKWRGAAQQAADELFETSRSRVERYDCTSLHCRIVSWYGCLRGTSMGGMKELAAMRRRQAEFYSDENRQGAPKGVDSDEEFAGEEDQEPPEEEEAGIPPASLVPCYLC